MPGGSVVIKDNSQLDLGGGTSTAAAFDIESGGFLDIGASYAIDPTTTISGTGGLNIEGGTVVLPANYAFTGPIYVEDGSLQVDGSLPNNAVTISNSGDGILSGTGTVGALSGGDEGGSESR